MPQTTSFDFYITYKPKDYQKIVADTVDELKCDGLKSVTLFNEKKDLCERLDQGFLKDPWKLLTRGNCLLFWTSPLVPPRLEEFMNEVTAEYGEGVLPERFYGETSIMVGRSILRGNNAYGEEHRLAASYVAVSLYCECMPENQREFESTFMQMKPFLRLKADLERVMPKLEFRISYYY